VLRDARQLRGLRPWDEARAAPGGYLRGVGSERDMSSPAGERPPGAYPAYPEPANALPRPPLTKRTRAKHWVAIDCVVGGFIALFATAASVHSLPLAGSAMFALALLFAATLFFPVALRRRAPVTAFAALVILAVLLSSLSRVVPAVVFLAAAYVLYTVTVESRKRTGAAALGLVIAITVVLVGAGTHGRAHGADPGLLVPVALANVIAWMTGYSVRQRRLYVVTLQQQAASSAVAEERLRIARELHDVVAHSMSVIAVQAGYGQYVIDASPGEAKDALGAIQATSRDALEEMRRMLGVLRQQDVTPGRPAGIPLVLGQAQASGGPGMAGAQPRQAPLAPAPGLAGLDKLIDRTRGAGVRVALEVSGHARPAPAGVDLSAYRIVQEALTNVVRHAGTAASCVVSVSYTDADVVVRVTDDGGLPVTFPSVSVASTGGGHGLIGMRERVHLCGGSFRAGPLPDGGFQVMAALPLPATVQVARQDPRAPAVPGAEAALPAAAVSASAASLAGNGGGRG
jgi:signal transduction histidine kinase